ncbi:hypothetical protein [Nitrospira sp. Kam-Ns4a]
MLEVEPWLRRLNESAAASRREAFEDLLPLHRLRVLARLRKTLHSTTPLERLFSTVRDGEGHLKRSRGCVMAQRWVAAVCLNAEQGFRRVNGWQDLAAVIQTIDAEQAATQHEQVAA